LRTVFLTNFDVVFCTFLLLKTYKNKLTFNGYDGNIVVEMVLRELNIILKGEYSK